MSRFQSLFSTIMTDHVQEKLEMGRKHLDAYRRTGLGLQQASESDEMKITSAGDVHYYSPPQQIPQQPQKSGIGPLLAAGLGMLGPAGAIGGYFLNQMLEQKPLPTPAPQVQQIQNTENLGMRLLRESDLQSPFDVDK